MDHRLHSAVNPPSTGGVSERQSLELSWTLQNHPRIENRRQMAENPRDGPESRVGLSRYYRRRPEPPEPLPVPQLEPHLLGQLAQRGVHVRGADRPGLARRIGGRDHYGVTVMPDAHDVARIGEQGQGGAGPRPRRPRTLPPGLPLGVYGMALWLDRRPSFCYVDITRCGGRAGSCVPPTTDQFCCAGREKMGSSPKRAPGKDDRKCL